MKTSISSGRTSHPTITTVVVTGADTPTGLTTARALRDLPVTIWGLTTTPSAPCCRSNVWARIVLVDADADKQIDKLLTLDFQTPADKKPLLFLSQDDLVAAASRRRDELARLYTFTLPSPDATNLMLDKTLFHTWAEKNGFAVPASTVVGNLSELSLALQNARFPVIVKPLVRNPDWDSRMGNRKVLWVRDNADIEAITNGIDLFTLCERYLVQSWIDGEDDDVYFCLFSFDESGHLLDELCGRKLMQWPPLTGSTAICHLIRDPALLEYSRDILVKAELRGLGSIEFKRDRRDGRYYITEPTVGRNDHQSAVSVLGHHNPTRALACAMLKIAYEPGRPITNTRSGLWIDELATYRHCQNQNAWRKFVRLFFSGLRHGIPHPLIFKLSDPKPFLRLVSSVVRRRLGS
ncbi:MAG: hypothetical protein WED00_11530 [Aquisalimonadaceae bacterium]